MSELDPSIFQVSIYPEASLRDGSGSGGVLADLFACDLTKQLSEKFTVALSKRQTKKLWVSGEGKNVSRIAHLGFKPGEQSHNFEMLTGIFLYYAWGGCSTAGTAYGSPKTDTLATRVGDHSVTVVTGSWTGFSAPGDMLKITNGTYANRVYPIKSWTANSKTLVFYNHQTILPADIMTSNVGGAPTVSIVTAPFTHTLSEANTLPSFAMHIEEQYTTNPLYLDLLGCVVKSIEIVTEVGSDTPVMLNMELIVAKVKDSIADSVVTVTTPDVLALSRLTWGSVSVMSLTYNSAQIETMLTYCKKHSFKLTNDVNMAQIFGDDYPNRVDAGKREYEIAYTVMIRNLTWFALSRLKCPDFTAQYATTGFYTTVIASNIRIGRSATDYIDLTLAKLRLPPDDFEEELPTWESDQGKEWKDVKFEGAPGNTFTGTIIDALSAAYYEKGGA